MFRHGVRSWVQNYPNETIPVSYWDQFGGLGQLTSVGVKQMTEFGDYFKNYYNKLMNKQFDTNKIFAKSTDYNRTEESVKAFLNGLTGTIQHKIDIERIPKNKEKVNT